jgi:hypothetical protein
MLIRIASVWVLCLVATSLQPWRPHAAHVADLHRLFHLLAFGVTALLLLLIARTARQRLYAVLAVVGLGIAIECAQHILFGSPLEWWDMRDNALAAAMAWLVVQWPAFRRTLAIEE